MQTNLPVWKYYEKDFVDPLYAPYEKRKVLSKSRFGKDCYVDMAKGKSLDFPKESVYPDLQRKGWGLNFQRKFSFFPCPRGFNKGHDNWCIQQEPHQEYLFYTNRRYPNPKDYFPEPFQYQGRSWRSNYGYCQTTSKYAGVNVSDSYL